MRKHAGEGWREPHIFSFVCIIFLNTENETYYAT